MNASNTPIHTQDTADSSLCPIDSVYCRETHLTAKDIADLEAMINNMEASLDFLAALGASAIAVAELIALMTGEIAPPALFAHGFAAGVAIAEVPAGLEDSQLNFLSDYVGEMKAAAGNRGIDIALYRRKGEWTPSLVYEGDNDGYSYGFTTVLGWLAVNAFFP